MELKKWSSNQKLEYWKTVENYEGLYMISSLGRVKSLERKVRNSQGKEFRTIKERILKLRIDGNGYLLVTLCKNGKKKGFLIHRLVANAFIPNVDNKPCIDHINTIRTDNRVCNLRWCTQKENCNNPLSIKKMSEVRKGKYTGEKNPMYGRYGEKNPNAKKVRCIETGEVFNTLTEAGEWSGIKSTSNIAKQIRGELKSTGKHPITGQKLTWEYVDEETIEVNLNLLNIDNINISL